MLEDSTLEGEDVGMHINVYNYRYKRLGSNCATSEVLLVPWRESRLAGRIGVGQIRGDASGRESR